MAVIDANKIATQDDISTQILSDILESHYQDCTHRNESASDPGDHTGGNNETDSNIFPTVSSLSWKALGRGVLSNVQLLTVSYEENEGGDDGTGKVSNSSSPPEQFLVKFRKPEIPLPDLFPVERQFYHLSEWFASSNAPFPFKLVEAIAAGSNWLMLEYVTQCSTMEAYNSCPPDVFSDLLDRLAIMHSLCWVGEVTLSSENQAMFTDDKSKKNTNFSSKLKDRLKSHAHQLSSTPGVGHTLPPSSRQASFASAWPAVRNRLLEFMEKNSLSFNALGSMKKMDHIVEWTSMCGRIANVEKLVAERKCTLIHGDFHVGNVLFPKPSPSAAEGPSVETAMNSTSSSTNVESMPWLVDWSMAGIGNPCIDLVFFMVVTSNCESFDSTSIREILQQYYTSLNQSCHSSQPCVPSKPNLPLLAWDDFLSMLRQCALNQFVILVCYDELCRSMAEGSGDLKEVYHDHFDRVNWRCVKMLLSDYGWKEDMLD